MYLALEGTQSSKRVQSRVSRFHSTEQPGGPLGPTEPVSGSWGWRQHSTWASRVTGSYCVSQGGPGAGPTVSAEESAREALQTGLEASLLRPPAHFPPHVLAADPRGHGAPLRSASAPHLRRSQRGRGPALRSGSLSGEGAAGPGSIGPRLRPPAGLGGVGAVGVCGRGSARGSGAGPTGSEGRQDAAEEAFQQPGLPPLSGPSQVSLGAGPRRRGRSPNPASRCSLRSCTE